jgi:hypothetical protein
MLEIDASTIRDAISPDAARAAQREGLIASGFVKCVWHEKLATDIEIRWHANPGLNRPARFADSTRHRR